ncbi:TPA: hypothetical protein ACKP01_001445 [Serratia liquefaciens]
MGLFDFFNNSEPSTSQGVIPGGKQKSDGSHDHRTNTGGDRTPSQKEGDKKREKNR